VVFCRCWPPRRPFICFPFFFSIWLNSQYIIDLHHKWPHLKTNNYYCPIKYYYTFWLLNCAHYKWQLSNFIIKLLHKSCLLLKPDAACSQYVSLFIAQSLFAIIHWCCGCGQKIYKSRNQPVTLYDKVKFKQLSLIIRVMNTFYQRICLTDNQD